MRYADIDIATGTKKKKSLLDTLKFWGSDQDDDKTDEKNNAAKQYNIRVADTSSGSKVTVENKDGSHNHSATANKILALLYEELK